MQKSIITTFFVVLFAGFISISAINAAPINSKADPTREKDSTEKAADEKRLMQRAEMQVKRLAADYNFTEEQTKEAVKLFADYERQINDLRTQTNALNKEKMEKFNAIVTPEQKKAKEEAAKLKKEQMKVTTDSTATQDIKGIKGIKGRNKDKSDKK
jgi:membrane-associated HD superfamily phosphohydrolase